LGEHVLTGWVGNFKAEEWNSEANSYSINPNVGIKITVDVLSPSREVLILPGDI
jgi:hypothetical protein